MLKEDAKKVSFRAKDSFFKNSITCVKRINNHLFLACYPLNEFWYILVFFFPFLRLFNYIVILPQVLYQGHSQTEIVTFLVHHLDKFLKLWNVNYCNILLLPRATEKIASTRHKYIWKLDPFVLACMKQIMIFFVIIVLYRLWLILSLIINFTINIIIIIASFFFFDIYLSLLTLFILLSVVLQNI